MTTFEVLPRYRRRGWLMLGITLMLAGLSGFMLFEMWQQHPLAGIAAGIVGLAATGLAATIALRVLRPRKLVIGEQEGQFYRLGRPPLQWTWNDQVRLDWHQPSDSEFATEEPVLWINDAQHIPLEPFGPDAYQAVRERTLLGSFSALASDAGT